MSQKSFIIRLLYGTMSTTVSLEIHIITYIFFLKLHEQFLNGTRIYQKLSETILFQGRIFFELYFMKL